MAFHDFPIGYAMLSLLVFSGATALRAYRWQVLLIGDQIPLHRLLLVQNVGTGLNSISPVGVLSEVSQFLLLTIRFKVRQEEAAATLGLQRVFDLVVGASLLGVGLLALPSLRGFAPYVAVAIALAAGSVLAVPLVIRFGSGPGLARIRLLTSTAAWLQKLTKARMKLALSLLVTLEYWILLGVSTWILAYGMNIDISLLVAMMVIIGTLTFVGIIPSLPASVGTFEFAVFYLLTTLGVGDGQALGFALVIHVILFLPPILITAMAFVTWSITGRRSLSPGSSEHEVASPLPVQSSTR